MRFDILSFLTLRDSIRTRTLSARWRHLIDNRSVLNFNALNIFGSDEIYSELDDQSKFVTAVDQLIKIWKGRDFSALRITFCLGNQQASHIDSWVESGIRMKIETLELNFSPISPDERYLLSNELFPSGKEFYLKHLRLIDCALTFSSGCPSWISRLSTLDLDSVPLYRNDFDSIMSGGLNLISLCLVDCCCELITTSINVELPCLRKLLIDDSFEWIELNCPYLESFEWDGLANHIRFSVVPLLAKVDLRLTLLEPGSSLIFDGLATLVPKLQSLSLCRMTEVQPLAENNTMSWLNRLDILLCSCPDDFDLFTVTYLLNAAPYLEILNLQMWCCNGLVPQIEYIDRPHLHLKEIVITRNQGSLNHLEFARYLLKNAVALERMVIIEDCECPVTRGEEMSGWRPCSFWNEMGDSKRDCFSMREEMANTLLQGLETTAKLTLMTRKGGVVLNASNVVGYGVQFSYPGSQ